jgi:hypothetical protein
VSQARNWSYPITSIRRQKIAFENKMLRAVLDSMPHNMSVTKMPLRDDKGELIGLVSATRESR